MADSMLDFYQQHGISPVRQDVSDWPAHCARRAALYRHLHLLPSNFTGKTVLEIGPGSGANALYIASLTPENYTLIEGNPKGAEDVTALFAESDYSALLIKRDIRLVAPLGQFDIVLCEGLLGLAGSDPVALVKHIGQFVTPGGVLVVTTIDALSDCSETLRRLLAQMIINPDDTLDQQVATLLPVFSPHLATVKNMTRRHDDWIIDNLLNPASIGPYFSIPDAIVALDDHFEIYGSSPHFLTDWRWYKDIGATSTLNATAIEQYRLNSLNLLDYRYTNSPEGPLSGRIDSVRDACHAVRALAQEYERTRSAESPRRTQCLVRELAETYEPLACEFREIAELFDDPAHIATARRFQSWFGRGQQYVSFTKR